MNKLKLIHILGSLLVFIVSTLPIMANAQTPQAMTAALTVPTTDVYCAADAYPAIDISSVSSANMHLCPRVSVSEVPSGSVVDWVLVELRAVAPAGSTNAGQAVGSTLVARKPAFILTNGRIVDAEAYVALDSAKQNPMPCTGITAHENCPDVEFDQGDVANAIENKDLYIVIRHRNHLDIISRQSVSEVSGESGVYAYDFSTNIDKAFGTGLKLKTSPSNMMVPSMQGGDADGNNNIGISDFNNAISPNEGKTGYRASDVNMDGNTGISDFNNVVSPNEGKTTQIPN